MFDIIKIERTTIIYLILIGTFLSANKWFNLYMGIINTIFSIIYSIISFFIILVIFNLVASFYGLYINFNTINIERKYSYSIYNQPFSALIYKIFNKKTNLESPSISKFNMGIIEYIYKSINLYVEVQKKINLSYLLTIILFILTIGFITPIIFSMNYIVIQSRRLGKSRSLEVQFSELIRIFFFSMIILWTLFSMLKYYSVISPIIYGFIEYFFYFLTYFTYFSIIPIGILLSPILTPKGYSYKSKPIGDILLMSTKPFYVSLIIVVVLLPILSFFFPPILNIIFIMIIFPIIWLRLMFERSLS